MTPSERPSPTAKLTSRNAQWVVTGGRRPSSPPTSISLSAIRPMQRMRNRFDTDSTTRAISLRRYEQYELLDLEHAPGLQVGGELDLTHGIGDPRRDGRRRVGEPRPVDVLPIRAVAGRRVLLEAVVREVGLTPALPMETDIGQRPLPIV